MAEGNLFIFPSLISLAPNAEDSLTNLVTVHSCASREVDFGVFGFFPRVRLTIADDEPLQVVWWCIVLAV